MSRTYRVTLKSPDGTTMFSGMVVAEEIIEVSPPKVKDTIPTNGPADNGGERMTDPQRRYLFRLLAAQEITGKAAEEHLKLYFQVPRLAEISRQAASEYIDQLLKDRAHAAS